MSVGTKSGNKDNSKRRYPGVGGRRHNPVGAEDKKREALERAQTWAALSPAKQLAALDARLGKGVGAQKQRARLQALIDNPPRPTKKDREAPKQEAPASTNEGERVKVKDRRAQEQSKRPGR